MATKTYPYAVIWKGKIIPANTPIKIEEKPVKAKEMPTKKQRARKAGKNNDSKGTD